MSKKRVHFVGIGGMGLSALARYYLAKGFTVSGSDISESEITRDLASLGVKISIGPHRTENLDPRTHKLIHTVAIDHNNPELKQARKARIKVQTYPQALGELTEQYFTIAVSGSHGKGTTTAFISLVMIEAGLDPTVIIGTNLEQFGGSNCRIGRSNYLVIEADEYQNAFLNYRPQIIVLTNIDKEHLDCFNDLTGVINAFRSFVSLLPSDGWLVLNQDDENSLKLIKDNGLPISKQNICYYSLSHPEVKRVKDVLKLPGEHNLSDALAAFTLARILKIPDEVSLNAFGQYQGAWRRFQVFQKENNVFISDYAHHPTEIKSVLAGTREKFKNRKIWAIFQPHQFQRAFYLFDEFVKSFDQADEIVLTKIFGVAGREDPDIVKKTSGQKLAEAVKKTGKMVHYIENLENIPYFLKTRIGLNDVVVVMGAGNIYKIVEKLIL